MLLRLLQWLEQQLILSNPSRLSLISLLIPPFLILLITFLFKWWRLFTSATTTSSKSNSLPPSPPRLPIIGNIHQLGTPIHRVLWSLSQRYGPVMLLHFGQSPTLVVSSPDAAREIMKTQDIFYANRPEIRNFRKLFYDMKDVITSPYGEHWRQQKSILVRCLLSKKRVQSFHAVREEETALLIRKISETCSFSPVEFRDLFVTLGNDVVCRAAFGGKHTASAKVLSEFLEFMGAFTFGDYVPMLAWLDRVSGMDGRVKRVAKEVDEFLEGLIVERTALLANQKDQGVFEEDGEDILGTLLKIQKDDVGNGITLSRDSIKAVLLNAYLGGADKTSAFLEWAMTELLGSPSSMKKLQNEVREVLSGKLDIGEDDLEKMEFLKAVIKETIRIHPPFALHSRTTKQDTKLMGYDIAAGTNILINNWGIANDPKLWDKPHEFRPERFVESSIDFKGQDFEFTPFGAGRRQCPGSSFAMATIEHVLASLVHKFNWELPGAAKGEDINRTECSNVVIHRKYPLRAIATPFSCQ